MVIAGDAGIKEFGCRVCKKMSNITVSALQASWVFEFYYMYMSLIKIKKTRQNILTKHIQLWLKEVCTINKTCNIHKAYLHFQCGSKGHLELSLLVLGKDALKRLFEEGGVERISHDHVSSKNIQNSKTMAQLIKTTTIPKQLLQKISRSFTMLSSDQIPYHIKLYPDWEVSKNMNSTAFAFC